MNCKHLKLGVMKVVEMIKQLKSESIKQDFMSCYLELYDTIKGLDSQLQFNIIEKTVEIAYKAVIETHNKYKFPKEVMNAALSQGNLEPIDFLKKYRDGTLEPMYLELIEENK